VSEHQTYEFLAVDQPLTSAQQKALRAISSRAEISSTRLYNEYDFGDFRGDPEQLMERYFDAHLYTANWGDRRLMLRIPRGAVDLKVARRYCVSDDAKAVHTKKHLVLDLFARNEGDETWDAPALATLARMREELMQGDLRPLYLAWLLCAQEDESVLEEPPDVPAGLKNLTGPQREFAEFFLFEQRLLSDAAKRSANLLEKIAPVAAKAIRPSAKLSQAAVRKAFEGEWRFIAPLDRVRGRRSRPGPRADALGLPHRWELPVPRRPRGARLPLRRARRAAVRGVDLGG
jgi:hypothetical protein